MARTVRDAAWAFGVPLDRIRPLVLVAPDVARAMGLWATSQLEPEQCAARYELPWHEPAGLAWEQILEGE